MYAQGGAPGVTAPGRLTVDARSTAIAPVAIGDEDMSSMERAKGVYRRRENNNCRSADLYRSVLCE